MTTLKWEDLCWMVVAPSDTTVLYKNESDRTNHSDMLYLGEAGNNTSYSEKAQVSAMRIGNEIVIQAPSNWRLPKCNLSSRVIVSGFPNIPDGKTLGEVMLEGVHYSYDLQRIIM